MLGPSEAITIPVTRRPRATSYSLSPEDRTFLPGYHQKQELITIKPQFNNELIAESIEQNRYLSSEEREKHLVTVTDGFFQDADGLLLNGTYVFVLHPKLRLYAANTDLKINHSHLSSGLPLRGAGLMYIDYGRLITLSNDSGHYKPALIEMMEAMDWFFEQTGTPFLFEDHSKQDKQLELHGIRYFLKDDQNLTKLDSSELSHEIYKLKVKALEDYKLHYVFNDSNSQVASASEDSYHSDDGQCYFTELSDLEVKLPMGESILDCPDLVQYTCLSRLTSSGRAISRYNGLPPRNKK